MERLIGTKVDVHLKCDESISGIIFDADDGHVYIQNDVKIFIAIPKENIKYYVGTTMNGIGNLVKSVESIKPEVAAPQITMTVSVNGVGVAQIPVPDDMDIASCNERVLKLIWSSPDVHNAIRGKVQKSLEYDMGYANITTMDAEPVVPPTPALNTFGMSMGGSMQTAMPFDIAKMAGGVRK